VLHVGWDGEELGETLFQQLGVDHLAIYIDVGEESPIAIVRLHIILEADGLAGHKSRVLLGRRLAKRFRIDYPITPLSPTHFWGVDANISDETAVHQLDGIPINRPANDSLRRRRDRATDDGNTEPYETDETSPPPAEKRLERLNTHGRIIS